MTQPDAAEIKSRIEAIFNTVSDAYDSPEMRYFPFSADFMIDLAKPKPGARVLDIATGTGMVAISAAQAIRPDGRVQAIDISGGMLTKAQKNISKHALTNIDMYQMDAEDLEFRSNYFDLVTCGFGVFFLPNPFNAVKSWQRVMKPGGRVIFSTFTNTAFMPMAEWFKNLYEETGKPYPQGAWQQFSDDESCLSLLPDDLFENKQIVHKQHGIHLKDEHEWWHIIESSGFRGILATLNEIQQTKLKEKQLKQLAELKTEDGIWLDVEVIYTQATLKD